MRSGPGRQPPNANTGMSVCRHENAIIVCLMDAGLRVELDTSPHCSKVRGSGAPSSRPHSKKPMIGSHRSWHAGCRLPCSRRRGDEPPGPLLPRRDGGSCLVRARARAKARAMGSVVRVRVRVGGRRRVPQLSEARRAEAEGVGGVE